MPGALLTRPYKGRMVTVTVTVLDNGFEHEGEVYRSLSAVAKAVNDSGHRSMLQLGNAR